MPPPARSEALSSPAGAAASRRAGVLFFAALVAFATFDAGAKRLLEHYPAPFLNVVRYVAVATLALFLLWRGTAAPARRAQRGLLVLRAMLATVGTCFMTALIWMPLSEATAIYFTSPLIMVALSPWLLASGCARNGPLSPSASPACC